MGMYGGLWRLIALTSVQSFWPMLIMGGLSALGSLGGAAMQAGASRESIRSNEQMFRQAAEMAAQEEEWKRRLWFDRERRLTPTRRWGNSMLYAGTGRMAPRIADPEAPPPVMLPWGSTGVTRRPPSGGVWDRHPPDVDEPFRQL